MLGWENQAQTGSLQKKKETFFCQKRQSDVFSPCTAAWVATRYIIEGALKGSLYSSCQKSICTVAARRRFCSGLPEVHRRKVFRKGSLYEVLQNVHCTVEWLQSFVSKVQRLTVVAKKVHGTRCSQNCTAKQLQNLCSKGS